MKGGMVTRNLKAEALFYKYIILNLEFAPSYETLIWADSILDIYSDRKAIIVTHAYLNSGSGYSDIRGTYGLNNRFEFTNGDEMWDLCFKNHPNVILILCGHHADAHQTLNIGRDCNVVYEIITDYQEEDYCGGVGWMRELKFHPTKNYITIKPLRGLSRNTTFTFTSRSNEPCKGYPADPEQMEEYNLDASLSDTQNDFHSDILVYPD
jgi:hypothetical protein